ncbi:MAG: ATP-binding cassette domain-containing protein [Methanomassiliicoccaceae archaeon]|nr:ATP-binding cassette domain-containing protein [Methanomassiliicoccaceae archaeon]
MNGYAAELENVSLVRNGVRILDRISLSICIGESVAVIGPNGSGKTSLMKLLKSDLRPYSDEGTVCRLFGKDRWNIFDLRKRMGFVSTELQHRFSGSMTAGAVILSGFFRTTDIYRDHIVTEEMAAAADVAAARAGISDKLSHEIGKMSLGEVRRTLIARALAPGPEMLLLDEPMTGLDIVIKEQFRGMFDSLIAGGTGIIMITHDLEDIPSRIDRVVMMRNGSIFADGRKNELLNDGVVSNLYASPVSVVRDGDAYRMRPL